jgi:hypothetical protein
MGKSRKNSVSKALKKVANNTLPVVNKSLTLIGTTTKSVANKSLPVVEKGVSTIYDTMTTGLDLGVKGMKKVTNSVTQKRKKTRSRSLAGGRRTKYKRHRRR